MLRASVVGLLIVLLTIIVACGEEATPGAGTAPAATPAAAGHAWHSGNRGPSHNYCSLGYCSSHPGIHARSRRDTNGEDGAHGQPRLRRARVGSPHLRFGPTCPMAFSRFLNKTSHESMWDTDNDSTQRPRLVAEWDLEEGPNGATYTFNLQRGAKWHDTFGDFGEFDADDFIFSIERIGTAGTPHAARQRCAEGL